MPRPDSLPWMEGVDAKVSRAREHFEVLEREIHEFLATVKYKIILKRNAEGTQSWLVFWVSDPYPPIHISAVAGDCLFNIRSALDNLVCGLVRVNDPTCDCEGRSFPICDTEAKYLARVNRKRSDLAGVPDAARKLITRFQPYNRPSASVEVDPLSVLNTLCNRDKHRSLILTAAYSRNTRFTIYADNGAVYRHTALDPMFAEGGAKTVDLPATVAPTSARVQASGTMHICFRESSPVGVRPVLEVIETCLRYVEGSVIPPLAVFFR